MSDYTTAVLAKFPDVPAAVRRALSAALAAARCPRNVCDHEINQEVPT